MFLRVIHVFWQISFNVNQLIFLKNERKSSYYYYYYICTYTSISPRPAALLQFRFPTWDSTLCHLQTIVLGLDVLYACPTNVCKAPRDTGLIPCRRGTPTHNYCLQCCSMHEYVSAQCTTCHQQDVIRLNSCKH